MKPRFSLTAQQWRLVTLLLSGLMFLSLAVPGSFVTGYYLCWTPEFEVNSGSYFAPCGWAGFYGYTCILLGVIALGYSIWGVAKKTNVFIPLLISNCLNLCIFAWVLYLNGTGTLLREGINISLAFVPPLSSALMPVAAFLARRAEKKG